MKEIPIPEGPAQGQGWLVHPPAFKVTLDSQADPQGGQEGPITTGGDRLKPASVC